MGLLKDRNGRDLTEADDIKKRWPDTQKYCTQKSFMTKIITTVQSLTQSQTSCNVKSSGPEKISL